VLNLIKYEFLGKYKAFGIVVIASLVLNIGLLFTVGSWNDIGILMLSICIGVGAGIANLIFSIGIFSEDIYEDKGYLTFTLPQNGYFILISKLIIAIIFYILTTIIESVFVVHFIYNISQVREGLDTIGVKINVTSLGIENVISGAIGFCLLLCMIYFAISITKLAVTKKRGGKFLAFIVFLIIGGLYIAGNWCLEKVLPQTFYINIFQSVSGTISNNASLGNLVKGLPVNIAGMVYELVVLIVLFIATANIIEKKLDL
jgi:hypothetical protein